MQNQTHELALVKKLMINYTKLKIVNIKLTL